MAFYKDKSRLIEHQDSVFDGKYKPGTATHFSGIYECAICGREAVSTEGHSLPPHNHHTHTTAGQHIEWKLIVAVQHNAS